MRFLSRVPTQESAVPSQPEDNLRQQFCQIIFRLIKEKNISVLRTTVQKFNEIFCPQNAGIDILLDLIDDISTVVVSEQSTLKDILIHERNPDISLIIYNWINILCEHLCKKDAQHRVIAMGIRALYGIDFLMPPRICENSIFLTIDADENQHDDESVCSFDSADSPATKRLNHFFKLAAERGHLEVINSLLRRYPNLSRTLGAATVFDPRDVLQLLLDEKSTEPEVWQSALSKMASVYETALTCAAIHGQTAVVKRLLEIVAKERDKESFFETRFINVPAEKNTTLQLLIDRSKIFYHPLYCAVASGNVETAKLFKYDATLAHQLIPEVDVYPFLLLAVRNQDEAMVDYLLAQKVTVDQMIPLSSLESIHFTVKDDIRDGKVHNQGTALHLAVLLDNAPIVSKLLAADAKLELDGATNVMFFADMSASEEVMQLLWYRDPDCLAAKNLSGEPVIYVAVMKIAGFISVERLNQFYFLIENTPLSSMKGAECNSEFFGGLTNNGIAATVLQECADIQEALPLLDRLLEKDVDTIIGQKETPPIFISATRGHLKAVETFLQLRPQLINKPDQYNRTVLYVVVRNYKAEALKDYRSQAEEIIKYLVGKGAHPLIRATGPDEADKGKTALDWARQHGDEAIIQLLEAATPECAQGLVALRRTKLCELEDEPQESDSWCFRR